MTGLGVPRLAAKLAQQACASISAAQTSAEALLNIFSIAAIPESLEGLGSVLKGASTDEVGAHAEIDGADDDPLLTPGGVRIGGRGMLCVATWANSVWDAVKTSIRFDALSQSDEVSPLFAACGEAVVRSLRSGSSDS